VRSVPTPAGFHRPMAGGLGVADPAGGGTTSEGPSPKVALLVTLAPLPPGRGSLYGARRLSAPPSDAGGPSPREEGNVPSPEERVFDLDLESMGLIGDYLLECRDTGHRPRTILLKAQRLRAMQQLIGKPLEEATDADLARWWRRLARRRLANNTRGTYLSHARSFYEWACRQDHLQVDPTRRLRFPRRRRSVPRDVDAAAAVAIAQQQGPRDRITLQLMLSCGLRCAEVAGVEPDRDLVARADGRWVLHVRGKGGHERTVRVPVSLARELRSLPDGPLLPNQRAGGHVSADWVSHHTSRLLRAGGLDATAHQLRHTYGTALAGRVKDLQVVQQQLGHISVATTAGYVRSAGIDATDAVEDLYDQEENGSS